MSIPLAVLPSASPTPTVPGRRDSGDQSARATVFGTALRLALALPLPSASVLTGGEVAGQGAATGKDGGSEGEATADAETAITDAASMLPPATALVPVPGSVPVVPGLVEGTQNTGASTIVAAVPVPGSVPVGEPVPVPELVEGTRRNVAPTGTGPASGAERAEGTHPAGSVPASRGGERSPQTLPAAPAETTPAPANHGEPGGRGVRLVRDPVVRVESAGTTVGVPSAPTVPSTAPAAPVTPAAAPTPTIAVPFATQIARPVFTLAAAGPGEHVVTVTVTPDTLGPVTVRAHVTADAMRVELFSPSELGRDALRSILPDLKRDLSGVGLNTRLDLSSQNQPSDSRGDAPWQSKPGAGPRDHAMRVPAGTVPEHAPRASGYATSSTIDVMA